MGLFNKKHRDKRFIAGSNESQKTLHKNLEFTATEQYNIRCYFVFPFVFSLLK